jgi:hypothetical protein
MKIDVYIPDSLNEITLGQYQKFLSIAKDKEQDLFVQQKMVEIFCKIDLKDIANIKYTSLVAIIDHFNKLFAEESKLIQTFRMDGLEFGFVPKLDDITFGEYVTLDTFFSDWENIDKAMEVLYRPILESKKGSYNIKNYEPEKYNMKNMPLDVVLSSIVFFYDLSSELLKTTLNYLSKQTKVTIARQVTSEENGDGTNPSSQSLMEALKSLTKLKTQISINA